MEIYTPNENLISYNGGAAKPYERKIKVNIKNKLNNENEKKIINTKNKNDEQKSQQTKEFEIKGSFNDNDSQEEENNKEINNIKINVNNIEGERSPAISHNGEEENLIYINEDNDNDSQNINEDNGTENYESQYQNEEKEVKEENEQENPTTKIKYKKIKIKQEKEEQENEEGGEGEEEEDEKEESDNFDFQEIKKKPGKLLHCSKYETFDEEGNRVITTKTIKEFKEVKGGIKIRKIQDEKEKIRYERYTEDVGKKFRRNEDNRRTHKTNKSDNMGDRFYLLAQLAKLKNDAEKNKTRQNQIYYSQSPFFVQSNNEYDIYENQNSAISNEMIESNNSFEEKRFERTYNYNPIIRPSDRYCPSQYMRASGVNEIENEYFSQNVPSQNQREALSPIGYIATYSSGSEDEMKSDEQMNYNNRTFEKSKSKKKIDKNIFKKEGELIKKSEIIYQMEDPNDYIGFNEKRKNRNLSTMVINTQNDTSKSEKVEFQSPDRVTGVGSDKFRKVTMAMISSLGPTCEDRKITRKMRSEIGGVVDLRQDLSPANYYKIKKFQRKGYNLNKEVNPKTKLEGARIIQYWWRNLKNKKLYMITYIKIVKIQSIIRTFLMRKRIKTTKITYYLFDILDDIINNNNKKNLLKLFEYYKKDKAKRKLKYLINKLDRMYKCQKLLKYFYKYKFTIDFFINKDNVNKKEKSISSLTYKKPSTKEENINLINKNKCLVFTPIKNDDFDFLHKRPQNLKVKLEEFLIPNKEKPALEIDKKEDYNIIKEKKIYKDEGTQKKPDLTEIGVNPEAIKNQIIKNEMINFENNKKITTEEGTNPTKVENKISNIPSININIIKPKKELTDKAMQYIEPKKYTSYEEILTMIIKKKENKDNLNLRKYCKRWNKAIKTELYNNNANKIIKSVKGYLIRNKIKNAENKKFSLKRILEIYEQSTKKTLKEIWEIFKRNCLEIKKPIEIKQGEYFSIIDMRPENKKEKIDEILLSSKEKTPLEINKIHKIGIIGKGKDLETKEEGTQNEIPKNKINIKVNQLNILAPKIKKKDEYTQNESYKPEISRNKLNIFSKIDKKDEGEQAGAWSTHVIKKNQSLKLIGEKPRKKFLSDVQGVISLEIDRNKKEIKEQGIQYTPFNNKVENIQIEIKRNKPKTKDSSSQYIVKKPVISRQNEYKILMESKKELIKKYKILQNSISIIQSKKDLSEQGQQCDILKKNKSIEVILGNHIKRNVTNKFMDIIEKIWTRKQKNIFKNKFKQAYKQNIIKREILRMYLLKWRFVEGYGGNKYGIIYDRNGKQIRRKEGLVNDVSIQNDLYDEIENSKLKTKQQQIKICKVKPINIKSNNLTNKKIMIDTGTGESLNHTLNSKIYKTTSISYLRRLKSKTQNVISNKNSFKINNVIKEVKNESTYMLKEDYKIAKESKLSYIGNDNFLTNEEFIEYRRRDLLSHIISKNAIREKYILNDYFSKWYKKTMSKIYSEQTKKIFKKANPKITKSEKFEIIHRKKTKMDKCVGNQYTPNKMVSGSKIEFKNSSAKKKDECILVNLPNVFKKENLWARKANNDIYKSYKKPKILRQVRGESQIFYESQNNNKLVRQEILDEINIRITEIFVKFIKTRNDPKCILRKYLSIWHRNSQYISLYENAKIIGDYCKRKLNSLLIVKKWKKLYNKYLFSSRQYKKMIILRKLRQKKYRLFKLIRITKLIKLYNRRKYLHYILMSWFLHTMSNIKKRTQMKLLYENMLTTYVSMADDMFGNNKLNNPSIQDCMFEIIDTNKFQTRELDDVPIAKMYYANKKGGRNIITETHFIQKEINEEKEHTFFKEINKKYLLNNERYEDKINKTEETKKTYKKFYKNIENDNIYNKSQDDGGFGKRTIINKEKFENIINNQNSNGSIENKSLYNRRYNNTFKSTSLDNIKTVKNESKYGINSNIINSEKKIKVNTNNYRKNENNSEDSNYRRRNINRLVNSSSQSDVIIKRRNNDQIQNSNEKDCEIKYSKRNNNTKVQTTDIKDRGIISEATYKRRNNSYKGNNKEEPEKNNQTDRTLYPEKNNKSKTYVCHKIYNNEKMTLNKDKSSPNINNNNFSYKSQTESKSSYSKKNHYASKYTQDNKE